MSQQLVQVQKTPLEEVCPIWSGRLASGDLTNEQTSDLMTNCMYCVVGEAHGWSSSYADHFYDEKFCQECTDYSIRIPRRSWEPNGLNIATVRQLSKEFAEHFKRCHQK